MIKDKIDKTDEILFNMRDAFVKASMGTDEVKLVEDGLVLNISEQKTPSQGKFVPSN